MLVVGQNNERIIGFMSQCHNCKKENWARSWGMYSLYGSDAIKVAALLVLVCLGVIHSVGVARTRASGSDLGIII